jgi:hypothetical protein
MIRSDQDGELNNKMAARRGKFNPCFLPGFRFAAALAGLQL